MFLVVACAKETPQFDDFAHSESDVVSSNPMTKSNQKSEFGAQDIVDAGYIEFVDNQYSLRISLKEAQKLGYDKEDYLYLEDMLREVNESIQQQIASWENDPEI